MSKNFSFNINTSFDTNTSKAKTFNKKALTPQEEYWLNRFLRDYAPKIFWLFILFFVFLFATIYFASKNGTGSVSTSNSININISN